MMSKVNSWEVPRIECSVDYENGSTPICNIHWKLTTKNTEGFIYTAVHNGFVKVDITPTEAMALTKESALTLLLKTLGNRVASIEEENSNILDEMIFPVIPVITLT
jgi:hypothetical protein